MQVERLKEGDSVGRFEKHSYTLLVQLRIRIES